MQTKRMSAIEALVNIGLGYSVAYLTYMFIISPLFGYDASASDSFWITNIFTLISFVRTYLIRRFFSTRIHLFAAWIADVTNR